MTYNRWSTIHIAHHLREHFWCDATYDAQMPLRPLIARPEHFEAVLTSRGVDALVLNRIQTDMDHGMESLHSDTASTGAPCLLALLYLKGQAQVFVPAGPGSTGTTRDGLRVAPGQLVMLDEQQGYRIWQKGPVELLALAVPLALIDTGGHVPQHLLASPVPDCASLRLFIQQMQLLDAWPSQLPEAEACMLSDLIIGTLRAVLQAGSEAMHAQPRVPMHILLRRVRQLIARQYPDPALDPRRIAKRLGISVRTLQSQLAREGTSLSAELMAYRLERAHSLLRGAGPGKPSIKEVSQRCGFSSPAHFSRRFSERFGSTPTGLLRGPQGASLPAAYAQRV